MGLNASSTGFREAMQRGFAARQRGDRVAAADAFRAALEHDPSHRNARLELALELVQAGQLDPAEALCRGVLADHPAEPKALRCLGDIARRRGDPAAALAAFAEAVAADPAAIPARLDLAQELIRAGRTDEAAALCRAVLAAVPEHPGALRRLGEIARKGGDREGALAAFRAAGDADPARRGARLAAATELLELGRTGEARDTVRALLAEDRSDLAAWMRLGLIERAVAAHDASRAAFAEAVARHPHAAEARVALAEEELALGHPQEAEAGLRAALALEPGHVAALTLLAEQALLAERPDQALPLARAALAGRGQYLPARLAEARAVAQLEGADAALRLLDDAALALGDRAELRVARAGLLRQQGRVDQARAMLHGAPSSQRGNATLRTHRAALDIELGDLDAAAAELTRDAGGRARGEAALHLARAALAEARLQLGEAKAHYLEALRLDPDRASAFVELARLALLNGDTGAAAAHLRAWMRRVAPGRLLRGQVLHISQTKLGQLLDEYLLDKGGLAVIAGLPALPMPERIERSLALVRALPHYTPAGSALLLALREAGLLPGAVAAGTGPHPRVPRRIAQYWADPDPPEDVARLMRSWSVHHPDWAWRRFDDAAATAFLAEHASDDVCDAYARASPVAQKADVFRLAWLYFEGGMYADADDLCRGPIGAILPPDTMFAAYLEPYATIGNNILLAAPRDPVIAQALADAVGAVRRGDADMLWLATGPGLITRAFAQVLADSDEPPADWLRGRVVVARHALSRAVWPHVAVEYKRTEAHWLRAAFGRRDPTRARRV